MLLMFWWNFRCMQINVWLLLLFRIFNPNCIRVKCKEAFRRNDNKIILICIVLCYINYNYSILTGNFVLSSKNEHAFLTLWDYWDRGTVLCIKYEFAWNTMHNSVHSLKHIQQIVKPIIMWIFVLEMGFIVSYSAWLWACKIASNVCMLWLSSQKRTKWRRKKTSIACSALLWWFKCLYIQIDV